MSKENLHLPKTAFSMKAELAKKEPEILKRWEQNNTYENQDIRYSKSTHKTCKNLHIPHAKSSPSIRHAQNHT